MIHEFELWDVEFAFLSRSVSNACSSNMVLVVVESQEEILELSNSFGRMCFKLCKIDEVKKGSEGLHDARYYLSVAGNDSDEAGF